MYNTKFYYDWNADAGDSSGWVWPGLLDMDVENGDLGYDMYIRGDVEDDSANPPPENFDFNDLINDERETYLTANAQTVQKNQDRCFLVITASSTTLNHIPWVNLDIPAYTAFYLYSKTITDDIVKAGVAMEKTDGTKLDYYLFHKTKLLQGIASDGTKLDDQYINTKYLKWDAINNKMVFRVSNKDYTIYPPDDTSRPINNIVVWCANNNYMYRISDAYTCDVMMYINQKVETDKLDANGNKQYDSSGKVITEQTDYIRYVKRNHSDIVAIETDMPVVEQLNMYNVDINDESGNTIKYNQDLKTADVNYARSYNSMSTVYVATRNLIRQHSKGDDENQKKKRDNAIKNYTKPWRTPTEYYSAKSNGKTDEIPHGTKSFMLSVIDKEDANAKKTVPIWWWCETFHNWCIFKKIKRHTVALYLWNGYDGWDRFSYIMKSPLYNPIVIDKYFYDVREFVRGPNIKATIDYQDMEFSYKSVKLVKDTKFSHYESNTFQTLKIAKAHVDDKGTSRYPSSTGIPPIMRLPSGEMTCLYELRIPGMSKRNEVIWSENIDFLNATCKAFFGAGDEKTIKDDWKNFEKLCDTSEESASAIFSADESSLVDADEINTTKENKEVTLLNLVVPRQYPEGKDISDESYVERWDR